MFIEFVSSACGSRQAYHTDISETQNYKLPPFIQRHKRHYVFDISNGSQHI